MLRPRNAIPKLPLTTIKFFINYISHDQSKTIGDSKNFALIQIMFIFFALASSTSTRSIHRLKKLSGGRLPKIYHLHTH